MDADGRRRICGSFLLALLGAAFALPARSEELQSQLGAEIARRFEETSIDIDVPPLKFGCQFSDYVSSRAAVSVTKFSTGWLILPSLVGAKRLEAPASLPQPTLVETFIAKGFPSGELSQDASLHDDSYLFARDLRTFRGMGFSR